MKSKEVFNADLRSRLPGKVLQTGAKTVDGIHVVKKMQPNTAKSENTTHSEVALTPISGVFITLLNPRFFFNQLLDKLIRSWCKIGSPGSLSNTSEDAIGFIMKV